MLLPQLRTFCENWLHKADGYQDDTLVNHFDKFVSLYVVFNSLYMQVMTELVIAGQHVPKDFKDKRAATDYVLQYLKSRYYIDNLLNDEASIIDLQTICNIIDQEQFHIILNWGQQKRDLDIKLLHELQSNSRQQKAKAILRLFYEIRCNMFHGHKGFEDKQRELLSPVNRLLRKTVDITIKKLNA